MKHIYIRLGCKDNFIPKGTINNLVYFLFNTSDLTNNLQKFTLQKLLVSWKAYFQFIFMMQNLETNA
jgi:hypothetical protein